MRKITALLLFMAIFVAPSYLNAETKTPEQLEKEKALKNPYPNDFGPEKIDISKYSPELQSGYKLMVDKCAKCHTPSRPLNSEFLDLKPEELEAAKKSNPEIFKDKLIWKTESGIWQRYIKRMMAKPGCNINSMEGKKIWQFIVEYSKKTKMGESAKSWQTHRSKLVADFKAKYPDRYKELYGNP